MASGRPEVARASKADYNKGAFGCQLPVEMDGKRAWFSFGLSPMLRKTVTPVSVYTAP